jgi:SAM-dependent methyltransferase
MSIAYYANKATEAFWSDYWQQTQLNQLLKVAARDPLTQHFKRHLPKSGLILEGGCGLGQYVLFFQQQGYRIIGGDFSLPALQAHQKVSGNSPLVGLDLCHMACPDNTFQAHISIGVIEHFEEGPAQILAEMYRTLAPGGVLLLTVPWVNGYRRLAKPFIEREQQKLRQTQAEFYQYAYTRQELQTFLETAGFQVDTFYPYSPAKGLREIRTTRKFEKMLGNRKAKGPSPSPGTSIKITIPPEEAIQGIRKLLYWDPILRMFAHMILGVAHKPKSGS